MKITTGPWVDGDEFFGRERELNQLGEVLQNKKASAFIPGPRRIGKTSLVMECIRRNRGKYQFMYLDLESRHSLPELCEDLIQEIQKSHPQLIKSRPNLIDLWNTLSEMFPKIKIPGVIDLETGKISQEGKETMDRMEAVFEELYKQDFIFAFDEFADFLLHLKERNIAEAKFFLSWLRGLRQEGKIRLIITGSINIISAIEELNVPDLVNDLVDIEILPLSQSEIAALIGSLARTANIVLTPEAMEFAVERLSDGIPFFIQLFVSGLSTYKDSTKIQYDASGIREIYDKVTGRQHKEFMDLHSRLKDYLSPEQFKAAKKILAHLAFDSMTLDDLWPFVQDSLSKKEALRLLLKRLEDECYLREEKRRFQFVSPMLADWWKNAYGWEKE